MTNSTSQQEQTETQDLAKRGKLSRKEYLAEKKRRYFERLQERKAALAAGQIVIPSHSQRSSNEDPRQFQQRPRPENNRPRHGGGGHKQARHQNRPHQQHRRHGGGGGGGGGHQNHQQHRQHAMPPREPVGTDRQSPPQPGLPEVSGLLHFVDQRDGQLRDPQSPLNSVNGGVLVSRQMISELKLRPGVMVRGNVKGKHMTRINAVEEMEPTDYAARTALYDGTALDPQPQIKLEHSPTELTTRIIDILAPVGFGQRGLIVAPPRTGKTILMQNIAKGIHHNHPDAELILLLVDERPEEVTDMRRNVPGTVYASSNDNTVEKHLDLAQLIIERCKRKVEAGKDVVVLLDSLTRVGRAFNTGGPSGGRTMTGGLDNRALEIPKKLFGAARKIENGGSLTILATCLIDTGSRMDQVIFEEFKGTGNMELTLDRNIANQRIFPALDIVQSGTRKEEKLLEPKQLEAARNIRRHLVNMGPTQAMKTLIETLGKFKTNEELYKSVRV
jgi:transcription termination factor Rho